VTLSAGIIAVDRTKHSWKGLLLIIRTIEAARTLRVHARLARPKFWLGVAILCHILSQIARRLSISRTQRCARRPINKIGSHCETKTP
jgi:hypothetical protein